MGKIQSSLNSISGTAAGAAVGLKHLQEQQVSNALAAQHQALIAEGQATDAEIAAKEAENENKTVHKDIMQAVVTKHSKEQKFNSINFNDDPVGFTRAKTDLEAAETALTELRNKYNANIAIQHRVEQQREYAIKARELANAKSKWLGGNK